MDLTSYPVFSTRKRQSVVCRYPDGRLVLYCKVIGSQEDIYGQNIPLVIMQVVVILSLLFHRVLIL